MGRRRKKGIGWGARLLALALLLALVGAGWGWWHIRSWTPERTAFPDQGVLVAQGDGAVNFRTLKAIGANFAYLEASIGADGKDTRFARNFEAAREAGLQVGAVHLYDPCTVADGQSANFVTMVPRGEDLLPPVIALARTADSCEEKVPDAAVASELMTLINQVEMHTAKPVILKLEQQFEAEYGISARLERSLWVTRTRLEPTYAGRPWLLWSANEYLQTEAADEPLEWVVVRP